ncbi:hypothetical protein DDZ14_09760 [Maritimibacter sp. 55A14]|uniref:hypothetical protein n=1 Tax=Maritimibacter sp. 55A14 TaxID=2174844 RepID=UPI000D616567|nr:hypothetical protein [Maritimibacter sp. 55A14]PWE32666.1 hypothetical protein DDZ14_09760 [Maritimibacter sp. 55A14]
MPKYVFAYHGGRMPDAPEERSREKAAWADWFDWFESLGASVLDRGNPLGGSRIVTSAGVAEDGGPNPVSGYTVVEAPDFDTALKMARGCPMLDHGGTVEVAEAIELGI